MATATAPSQSMSALALIVGMDPIVHRFIADLDAKDSITSDHVIRTMELAVRVGEEMRLGVMKLRDLGLAAILHDVGKVGIPDVILNKLGRLTRDEFEIMREHAEIGDRMVRSSPVLASIAPAVRGHHERLDGSGYPDGLVGYEICQNARIVAVCDAYDAMANARQYRAGMGHDKAIAILREHSGSQWDPVAVEALVMTLARQAMVEELPIQIDKIGRDWLSATAFDPMELAEHSLV
jgi:HD-GYP domain-containing protein (c-di-GMP phosphodiesterase class II)